MDGKITFKELLEQLDAVKAYCDREDEFRKQNPDNKYGHSEDYIKGYRAATLQLFSRLKDCLPMDEVYPEIREATDEERKEFTIKKKMVATSMDVAINQIYGLTLEEGKEYDVEEVPYGIFEYRGEKVPVYVDDPGQQDYCVYKGEVIPGGTYNMCPEIEFAHWIDYKKFYEEKGAETKDE